MGNTLIIYEEDLFVKQVSNIIGHIVVNTKRVAIGTERIPMESYTNIIFVTTDKNYNQLSAVMRELITTEEHIANFVSVICNKPFEEIQVKNRVGKKEKLLFVEEPQTAYEVAVEIATLLGTPAKPMPKEELFDVIEEVLKKHNTCGLATGIGHSIRCTPIEYQYAGGALYLMTEGGKKFYGILQNQKVGITVFEPYTSMTKLEGLQIQGEAEILSPDSEEYSEVFQRRGITSETLKRIPIEMDVVKVWPVSYEILCSEFKKQGYDSKQIFIVDK